MIQPFNHWKKVCEVAHDAQRTPENFKEIFDFLRKNSQYWKATFIKEVWLFHEFSLDAFPVAITCLEMALDGLKCDRVTHTNYGDCFACQTRKKIAERASQ